MNGRLAAWLKDNYSDVKSDLFSAFIVRNTELALHKGQLGFMSPFVWMFISSYEKLRSFLINQKTITSLVQLEYSGFDGATVPICTFTVENAHHPNFRGGYVRLSDFRGSENQGPKTLEAIKKPDSSWFYRASAADFKKIPGSPIAYWASKTLGNAFEDNKSVAEYFSVNPGIRTGKDKLFLRLWFEVSHNQTQFELTDANQMILENRWFPLHKGGNFRKWYGNGEHVIDLYQDGIEIKTKSPDFRLRERKWYFKPFVSWSRISSASIAFRYFDKGVLFSDAGPGIFAKEQCIRVMGLLNSKLGNYFLKVINPTLNYQKQDIETVPYIQIEKCANISAVVDIERIDWDNYETSWDFKELPLTQPDFRQAMLKASYNQLREHWQEMTLDMQRLEEENNRIFIEAYGLQDELTPNVPLNEITLTCNPHYRYNGEKSEEELEKLLLADTMKEFISFAVGCMFGRYSLDKSGLILASQGETIEDYLKQIPEPTFPADDDNVIPILEGNWFIDDITERFQKFLRVTFGEEHYDENLTFIENAIGKDIRKFFLKDFYADHVKRYKKRPIYWMFSSPKGSFNALIYMHRYRPDTVSVILNDYLREFKTKLSARKEHMEQISISASAIQSEKTNALKEIEKLKKLLDELETWEHDVLYPLASRRIKIDLDDGVKVNYNKFGPALKKVAGLSMDH
ncbi:MAG: hypothetical protein SRB2_00060 [Desulfobacteraceae bacterium Eth-SRB2]|nr:MAG: hypothetical protein SRB2_00060 [Desulfobacteraceae bacterium Eth-SRB2]